MKTKNKSRQVVAIISTIIIMMIAIIAGVTSLSSKVITNAAVVIPEPIMEFTITNGTGNNFTAIEKDGKVTQGITDVSLTDLIAAIDNARTSDDVTYDAIALNFGNGSALNLGANSLALTNGDYIIQSGTITSSNASGITDPTIAFSGANLYITGGEIKNIGGNSSSRTLFNSGNSNIFMSGGKITETLGRALHNSSTGEIVITGGTVSATSGYAIYGASAGKITISQADDAIPTLITSSKNAVNQGTIMLNGDGSEDVTVLEVTGGKIENIIANSGNAKAIHCQQNGNIVISGGIITAAGAGTAIYNNGTGELNISNGTVATSTGYAIYNNNIGTVTITGGIFNATTQQAIYNEHANGNVIINGGRFNVTTGNAIRSKGNVTITGGEMIADGNGYTIYNQGTGNFTIAGGNISTTTGRAIYNSSSGEINIFGGIITATTGHAVFNNSTGLVTITGGTISATTGRAIFNNSTGEIIINEVDKENNPTFISSANTNSGQGTIHMNDAGGSLKILGGEINNSAGGNLVYNSVGAQLTLGTETLAVTLSITLSGNMIYTSNAITPEVSINGLNTTDFGVSYSNNINSGTANILIELLNNYGSAVLTIGFNISKADGAAVIAPTRSGAAMTSSITINEVTSPANGQTVEYAINMTTDLPVSGWQTSLIFDGLTPDTTYYIFARSIENDNYNTGTAVYTEIKTDTVRAPSITGGQSTLTLTEGYSATSTNPFTINGSDIVTVVKVNGNDKITWNNSTKKLDIGTGITAGTYVVTLKVSNGTYPDAIFTFMLTVEKAIITPVIAPSITGGQSTMTLAEGYSATSTNAFTITGSNTVTVTKVNGNDKITWNDSTKKLDINTGITAGTYIVTLKASNGTNPDALYTFTLIVTGNGNEVKTPDNGLSAGAAAGIGIAGTIITLFGSFSIFWFVIRKKSIVDLATIFKNNKAD